MFDLNFVPTIYDHAATFASSDWLPHNKPANQIAHCSIIANIWNELQNKHWNFATNIPNLQTNTFEVIF